MLRLGTTLIAWLAMYAISVGAPTAPIVYVSGNGTGDFNCDGADDQVEINQALTYVVNNPTFTTVYLKGPRTYVISASVKIGSNTTLTGDATAVIKLKDHAGWAKLIPMVTMMAAGNHDIVVHGFEIDGNDINNYDDPTRTQADQRGQDRYNMLAFTSVTRLAVYGMYIHDNMNDGLKVTSCSYVDYHDNQILRHGHDGLYAYKCSYVNAYNNTITIRTNSGIRFSESNHCKAYNNRISKALSGGSGFEIQRASTNVMDDIEVYNNVVSGTAGAGVWIFGCSTTNYTAAKARNIHISNNVFYSCSGGIKLAGFFDTLIENNVIDGCGSYGINATGSSPYLPPSGTTGFNTVVRNNIICNNTAGIANTLSGTHSFTSSYNCFFQNSAGNITGANVASSNELLNVNPLFVSRTGRDYHVQSTGGHWNGAGWIRDAAMSPCIDAGYPQSAFNLEPQPNGGRVNIGAYGNTAQASKSYSNAVRHAGAWLACE